MLKNVKIIFFENEDLFFIITETATQNTNVVYIKKSHVLLKPGNLQHAE